MHSYIGVDDDGPLARTVKKAINTFVDPFSEVTITDCLETFADMVKALKPVDRVVVVMDHNPHGLKASMVLRAKLPTGVRISYFILYSASAGEVERAAHQAILGDLVEVVLVRKDGVGLHSTLTNTLSALLS